MNNTKLAIAGLGNAAVNLHLPAIRGMANVTVVGGCDPSETARTKVGADFGFPVFATATEMLRSGKPDVVVVCAPPKFHKEIVLESFRAGAHVICEKPLATTVADAQELVQAAKHANRFLALNHEFREMPAFRALLDQVQTGGARPVVVQAWQNMDRPPWAEPGWRGTLLNGVLYEAGIHLVDYVLAVFRETPVAVNALMSACGERPETSDATALVSLEFSDGRLAQITQNRFCKGETQYFEVRVDTRQASYRVSYGGRARVSAGLLRSTQPHLRVEFGKAGIAWREQGHQRKTIAANPGNAPMVATGNLLSETLSAFASNQPAPASGEDGYNVLRVLAAAYLSASEGRRIRLDADAEKIAAFRFE